MYLIALILALGLWFIGSTIRDVGDEITLAIRLRAYAPKQTPGHSRDGEWWKDGDDNPLGEPG